MDTDKRHMVVGLDGSAGSAHALAWAHAHVSEFGLIQPVACWHYPWWELTAGRLGRPLPTSESIYHTEAERVASQMLDRIPMEDRLETLVVHGPAGSTLVDVSSKTSLIVVGTRGRSDLASGVLGSVSRHCVNHATVPVAVVPSEATITSGFERVVVGIDGSDNSVAALTWALSHTSPSTSVTAVHAWTEGASATAEVAALARDRLAIQANELAAETVERAQKQAAQPDRQVSIETSYGDPRMVVKSASEGADLLVIGARGRENVAYLLVGSVATALANHPQVTTIVVR